MSNHLLCSQVREKNPHHLVPAAPSKQGYEELTTAVVEDWPLGMRMELRRVFNRRYGLTRNDVEGNQGVWIYQVSEAHHHLMDLLCLPSPSYSYMNPSISDQIIYLCFHPSFLHIYFLHGYLCCKVRLSDLPPSEA